MWNEGSVAARGDVEGLAEGLAMDDVVHVGRSWFRMTPAVAAASGDDEAVVVRSMPVSKTARLGEIVVVPPDDMTARSLFESAFETSASPVDELIVGKPRRTVTVSLWGLATLGAALLLTGAAVTVMLRPQPAAPIAAPAVTAPAPVATAPVVTAPVVTAPVASAPAPEPAEAPVIVEQLAAAPPSPPSPPTEVVAVEPPVAAAAAVHPSLVRKAPMPVATPVRRLRPAAPPKHETAVTVPDPFAPPPAKKAWVDPFAD